MPLYYSEESRNKALKILQERDTSKEKPLKECGEYGDVEEKDDDEEEITIKIEKEEKESEEEPAEDGDEAEGDEEEKAEDEKEEEPVEESEEDDEDKEFTEWFNEEMKKNGFSEGLFDNVKAFLGQASDTIRGGVEGAKAVKAGKGLGDSLSIAGTTMKAEKFRRAYKELWLGFNKGLKIMNPKLQAEVSNNEEVRESVNQILGAVIAGLEVGKIKKLADASTQALPGTNPEQDEAKAAQQAGGDAEVPA